MRQSDIGAALAAAALALCGTPFRHQARLPGVGTDCGGVLVLACADIGYPCQDIIGYRRRPSAGQIRECLLTSFDRVPPGGEHMPGDILLLDVSRDNWPCHIGIALGAGRYVHADADPRFAKVSVALLDANVKVSESYRVRGE